MAEFITTNAQSSIPATKLNWMYFDINYNGTQKLDS